MLGSFWIDAQLAASEEGLSSMKLVSKLTKPNFQSGDYEVYSLLESDAV
jgi:hypothetical protein